ncbi:MAG: hypothetical protein ACO1RX_02520 [Candidatus Sericytochromatia bacterium]
MAFAFVMLRALNQWRNAMLHFAVLLRVCFVLLCCGLLACQPAQTPGVPQASATAVSTTPEPTIVASPIPSPVVVPTPTSVATPAMPSALPLQLDASRLRLKGLHKKRAMKGYPSGRRQYFFTGSSPGLHFAVVGATPQLYMADAKAGLVRVSLSQASEPEVLASPFTQLAAGKDALYGVSGHCVRHYDLASGASEVMAGKCDESGYRDGAAAEARFSEVMDVALGPDEAVYVSEFLALRNGLRLRKIEKGEVTTEFDSAPIGTPQQLRGYLLNGFEDYLCEGVCRPGRFSNMPLDKGYSYYWQYANGTVLPGSFYIEKNIPPELGNGELILVIRDGSQEIASVWDPTALEIDKQGQAYILNRLCNQGYVRRISFPGALTTLVRENGFGHPVRHTLGYFPGTLDSMSCESSSSSASKLSFAIDRERQLMYLYSEYGLFVFDLQADAIHSLIPLQADWPDIISMEVSEQGHLYAQALPRGDTSQGSWLYQIELEVLP